jgi:predicted dehydrogenase
MLGRELGINTVLDPAEVADLGQAVAFLTDGHGADAALLCAGVKDSGVTNRALAACRDRARAVMIGDMGLDLTRDALFAKELAFRVSRSYGPGRYDAGYEGKGLDYPIGYVRWTEGRNLACFLDQVARGVVRVRELVARRVPMEDARAAYRTLIDEPDSGVAVLLTYAEGVTPTQRSPQRRRALAKRSDRLRVGVVGCGSFVSQQLLPHFADLNVELYAVANRTTASFPTLEARFHPVVLATSADVLLNDPAIDAFLVGTRHNLHAALAERIVRAGKPVHVEKPMAMTVSEAQRVAAAVGETDGLLTVGFNRRFAPTVEALVRALETAPSPRQFLYRVNALPVPLGHWTLDPLEGGGRLVGEGCHFIDLLCFLADSDVAEATGAFVGGMNPLVPPHDNLAATLRFANGDLATVIYSGQGAGGMSKERLEVFSAGRVFVIDDFLRLDVHGARTGGLALRRADKGFRGHLENFFDAVRGRATLRTTVDDGVRVSRIIEALAGRSSTGSG